jgi:glycolate oxidase iron-sulfur subunit
MDRDLADKASIRGHSTYRDDALSCAFCGNCEWVCPTLKIKKNRIYGPRGRITAILNFVRENVLTDGAVDAIFTCLQCGACVTQCPANIRIDEDVRTVKSYLINKNML